MPYRRVRKSCKRYRRLVARRFGLERLEHRLLMAADWRNPADATDANGDGAPAPLDALLVINRLNTVGPGALPAERLEAEPYFDVSGDGNVSPLDALIIINDLNARGPGKRSLTESNGLTNQVEITITAGPVAGSRKYRIGLDVQFDTSDTTAVAEDVFSVYLVDPANRSQTLLDRGHPGTALFQLHGALAEGRGGITSWDGTTLEMDLSSVTVTDTAILVLQLINHDADLGSRVTVNSLSNVVHPSQTPAVPDPPMTAAAATSGAIDTAELAGNGNVKAQLENVRFDKRTGRYAADLRLVNNTIEVLSKAVVLFPDLHTGVTLRGASGTAASGVPYLNITPVLPRDGLEAGQTSQRILLEFDNPAGVAQVIRPLVLARTGVNQGPTLEPIGTLRVNPGGSLVVPLRASDPDGDPLTYSIGGASRLPSGKLQANGTLVFTPTLDDVGTYEFLVVASDGSAPVSQPVTLVVKPDASTDTRLSGVVQNTRGEPIPGVTVGLGGVVAVTASDGSFLLDFSDEVPAEDRLVVQGQQYVGSDTYSQLDMKLSSLLGRELYVGEENALARPIYLVSTELEQAETIQPGEATTVTPAGIPGASITFFADTVYDRDGNLYRGPITFTEVPLDRTPLPLSQDVLPSKGYMIQPSGLTFSTAPRVTLPNTAGYPAGTVVEICETAQDKNASVRCEGFGNVGGGGGGEGEGSTNPIPLPTPQPESPTGTTVFFYRIKDHIVPDKPEVSAEECDPCEHPASPDYPRFRLRPIPPPGSPPSLFANGKVKNRRQVGEYKANERDQSIALVYDSERADPQSVFTFGYSSTFGAKPGELMWSSLSVGLGAFRVEMPGHAGGSQNLSGGDNFWSVPTGATTVAARLAADFSSLPSGRYQYSLGAGKATVFGGNVSGTRENVSGSFIHVNGKSSTVGAGWGMVGLQQAIENYDGSVLILDGDGTKLLFELSATTGGYMPPLGDFSQLEKIPGGGFRRTTTDHRVYTFNARGQLARNQDRTGHALDYQYLPDGRLDRISDSAGQITQLAYLGERIASITDPGGRATRMQYDAAGNLTRIDYPDGSAESWEYDSRNRMVAQTGPRGERTAITYNEFGRATDMAHADATIMQLVPSESVGLFSTALSRRPESAPPAQTAVSKTATFTDGRGNVTVWELDEFGQFKSGSDSLGSLGSVQRVENLVTREVDPRGNVTLYVYDGHGNLVNLRDSLSGDVPFAGTIQQPGEHHSFSFDAAIGQKIYINTVLTTGLGARLLHPDGGSSFLDQGGPVEITQSGMYTVQVTGDQPGTFAVQLQDVSNGEELQVGDERIGTLDPTFGPEVYRFQGLAGQYLIIEDKLERNPGSFDTPPAARPTWQIYDPLGRSVIAEQLPLSGTYTLVMRGSADYHFQLRTPPVQQFTYSVGSVAMASFAEPGERQVFGFSGVAGQLLLYDLETPQFGNGYLEAQLISPSGQNVTISNFTPFSLGETGNYQFVLRAPDAGAVRFQMRDAASMDALSLDTVISGEIRDRELRQAFQFQGTAGTRLLFDSLAASTSLANFELFGPGGDNLFQRSLISDTAQTLPLDGTYILAVRAYSDDLPITYQLRVTDITDPPVALDGLGVVHEGTIAAGEVETFQFTASAGTKTYFDSQYRFDPFCSTCNPVRVTIRDPSNNSVLFAQSMDSGPVVLPLSGTYTITVRGVTASATGDFKFRVLNLADAPELQPGEILSGSLADYQTLLYKLAAPLGEAWYYDALASLSYSEQATIRILTADGDILFSSDSFTNDAPLIAIPHAGTYYLAIEPARSATGQYDFRLLAASQAEALTRGSTIEISMASSLPARLFAFHGAQGERILARTDETDFSGHWSLFSAAQRLDDNSLRYPLDAVLPAAGRYYLLLDESFDSALEFGFQLDAPHVLTTQPLSFNTPLHVSLPEFGDQAVYAFAGAPGQRLEFTGLGSELETAVRVIAPSGSPLTGFYPGSLFTLTEAGEYLLEITALAPVDSSFQMFDVATLPAIALETILSGSIPVGGGTRLFAIDGVVGQQLYFQTPVQAGQGHRGWYTLYDPENDYATQFSSGWEVKLNKTGRYVLQLPGDANVLDYSLRVYAPETTVTPLVLGAATAGAISIPGEVDTFTFTGSAGQLVYLDDLSTTYQPKSFALVAPDGKTLDGNDSSRAFWLPLDGEYTLEVRGLSGATPSYDFRLIDGSAAAAITPGTTTSDAVAGGETDIFRIEGVKGQRFSYDMLSTGLPSGQWRVLSQFGGMVAGPGDFRDFGYTLAETAPHYLLIESYQAPANYNFTLSDVSQAPVTADGLNSLRTGTVPPNTTIEIPFTASAGQRLLFDQQGNSSLNFTLRSPDGSDGGFFYTLGDTGPFHLGLPGTYSVRIQNSAGSPQQYSYRLLDLDHLPALPVNSQWSASLDPGTTTEVWQFEGRYGQRLLFDLLTDNSNSVSFSFRRPDGKHVGASGILYGTDPNPLVIDQTGRWTLYAEQPYDVDPAEFTLKVYDLETLPLSPLEENVAGAATNSELAVYAFEAAAGQQLYFDSISTSQEWSGQFRLYGPAGNQPILSKALYEDAQVLAPAAGRYTLVVQGASTPLSFEFRVRTPPSQNQQVELASVLQGRNRYTYGAFNQLVRETDELGHQTLYEIDPQNGNRLSRTQVMGELGGNDDLVTRYSYLPNGLLETETDPLGRATNYAYDAAGRTVEITFAQGTPDEASIGFEYDEAGNRTAVIDANGHRTEFEYDLHNRLVRQTDPDPDGLGPAAAPVWGYTYDLVGNVTSLTDPRGFVTQYRYDELNRIKEVIDGDGFSTVSTFDANGNTTSTTDRMGRTTTFAYDQRNRLVEEVDALGGVTQHEYDLSGNLTAVVDRLGRRTELAYDARSRWTASTDPAGHVIRQVFDPLGNLVLATDPRGSATIYAYDDANRLTRITDALGNFTEFTYDLAGNTIATRDRLGRVSTAEYDHRDRPLRTADALGHATQYSYDAAGNVLSVTDPLLRTTSWQYDALHRPIQVDDALGGVTRTAYDALGNVLSVRDPLGRTTQWQYDALSRATRIVDPAGQAIDMLYDASGNLTRITDRLQRSTHYAYDNLDRLIVTTDAAGGISRMSYDAEGNVLTSTDALGRVTRYGYDELNRVTTITDPLSGVRRLGYDASGNVVSVLDELGRTRASLYDPLNRLVKVTDPLGGVRQFVYDAAGNVLATQDELGRTTTRAYDQLNRLTSVTDALGFQHTNTYDAAGRIVAQRDPRDHTTTYQYDALDRLTRITNALGGQLSYAYDAVGHLLQSTDELGHATSFAYDVLDRLAMATDALGGETRYSYDVEGNLLEVRDPLDRPTRFTYDALNRLTRITDALDGQVNYAYDAVGNLISLGDPLAREATFVYDDLNRQIQAADPLGNATHFAYDAAGNLVKTNDASGRETAWQYDALDRPTEQTDPLGGIARATYDAAGNVLTTTDELGRTTRYEYDDLNRQTRVIDPLDRTTRLEYDSSGNLLGVTDPLEHTTSFAYDALHRRVSQSDANGHVTGFAYDAAHNLVRVTDPVGNETEFVYDPLHRLTREINELEQARTFEYDAVGNLLAAVDRNNRRREFTFDALNRLTDEIWLGPAQETVRHIQTAYDAASQMLSAGDAAAAYTFTYDAAGRLSSVTNAGIVDVPVVSFAHAYDAVHNHTARSTAIAGQAAGSDLFTYDELDRLTRVVQTGAGVADKRVDFSYDAASQPLSIARFADLDGTLPVANTQYTFDAAGRLSSLVHDRSGDELVRYAWVFDAGNRLVEMTTPEGISTLDYDDRGQLLSADHAAQTDESFTYDANGNRTNAGYQTGTNNRLLSDGEYTYEYDGEGNRIRRTSLAEGTVTEYTWDHRNRLSRIVEQAGDGAITSQIDLEYDIFDRRIGKSVDADGSGPAAAEVERYVYDGDHIALVFDVDGDLRHRYLHGPQVDQILADEGASGEVLWALTDHQGTVRDLVDRSGAVVNHLTYDSFGRVTTETNAAVDFLFGFTGRERDESGLWFYRARYYDPAVGRFVSEDPIGFAAGDANLTRYVGNAPPMMSDPYGLDPKCDDKKKKRLKGRISDTQWSEADEREWQEARRAKEAHDAQIDQRNEQLRDWRNQHPHGWDSGNGGVDHSYTPPPTTTGSGTGGTGDGSGFDGGYYGGGGGAGSANYPDRRTLLERLGDLINQQTKEEVIYPLAPKMAQLDEAISHALGDKGSEELRNLSEYGAKQNHEDFQKNIPLRIIIKMAQGVTMSANAGAGGAATVASGASGITSASQELSAIQQAALTRRQQIAQLREMQSNLQTTRLQQITPLRQMQSAAGTASQDLSAADKAALAQQQLARLRQMSQRGGVSTGQGSAGLTNPLVPRQPLVGPPPSSAADGLPPTSPPSASPVVPTGPARSPESLALGLYKHFDDWAVVKQGAAEGYRAFPKSPQTNSVAGHIRDAISQAKQIHFNLKGVKPSQADARLSPSGEPFSYDPNLQTGGWTNYELGLIREMVSKDPAMRGRLIWYNVPGRSGPVSGLEWMPW